MEKTKLNRFISKYFLNGNVESVAWKSNGNLSVNFVDDSKSLIGEVVYEKAGYPEAEFGVNQTSKLKSLLGVLSENINVEVVEKDKICTTMKITDNNVDVSYMLSDMTIIPQVPVLKTLPEWDLTVNLDEKFIDNFIKASGALSDVREFAIVTKNNKTNFVIGHTTVNSTKVSVIANTKEYKQIEVVYFPTGIMREILSANKEAKVGTMLVSEKGLAKITFNVDEFKSSYYLVSRIV